MIEIPFPNLIGPLLPWLSAGLVGLGTALIFFALAWGLADLARALWRLRRRRWERVVQRYFAQPAPAYADRQAGKPAARGSGRLTPPLIAGLGLVLAAKALADAPLVAAYLAGAGLVMARYLSRAQARGAQALLTAQVGDLVSAYRSVYLVNPALFPALEEAARNLDEPLKNMLQRAIQANQMRIPPERIFADLRRVGNPYLNQFLFILERAPESDAAAVSAALAELEARLRQRAHLQGRAKVALAMLSGTVRFLQGANLAAILIALWLPLFWNFYASSLQRQGIFLAAVTAVLVGSVYFDQELAKLQERVL